MPPKVKITKEDIINTTLSLVRLEGSAAINARRVAAELGCSTQPVFSNFSCMEQLQVAVLAAAYEVYLGFIGAEVESEKYPRYKSFGLAYIRFAREERELFKLLFMRDRTGEELSPAVDFKESVDMIAAANGFAREVAERFHLEMWATVHGIGTMLATSFLNLDEALISDMITDVYQGLLARYKGERE